MRVDICRTVLGDRTTEIPDQYFGITEAQTLKTWTADEDCVVGRNGGRAGGTCGAPEAKGRPFGLPAFSSLNIFRASTQTSSKSAYRVGGSKNVIYQKAVRRYDCGAIARR